jgi:hypothetical protein
MLQMTLQLHLMTNKFLKSQEKDASNLYHMNKNYG